MTRDTIRALVDAATPGPWKKRLPGWIGPDRHKYGCVFFGPSPDEMYTTSPLTPADAAFIAASRTAVPLLLAVADAAALDIAECGTCQTDTRGYCYRHQAAGIALAALEATR